MTNATIFTPNMALITGNTGGVVQSLPNVNTFGGRVRAQVSILAMAAQAAGSVIGIARLPIGACITDIIALTDTSLATAQIAFGDANNITVYGGAQVLTTINTPTSVLAVPARYVPITAGYDCTNSAASKSYEDITMWVSVASLPASGNLVIVVKYMID